MDLAHFPHLQKLDLWGTDVTGDIRDIREHDFPAMEDLRLPSNMVGGRVYDFQRKSDVPSFMQSIYPLLKRTPSLFDLTESFRWWLSEESPDWYEYGISTPKPPFYLEFVQAGPRLGWRWSTLYFSDKSCCEVSWLDPEPSSDSEDYQAYVEESCSISNDA